MKIVLKTKAEVDRFKALFIESDSPENKKIQEAKLRKEFAKRNGKKLIEFTNGSQK